MEYVVEIFSFTIIFAYLFYKWANKNFECFSSRNVAHEKPVFLIGNNLTVLEGKESSSELLIRLHNQFKNEKIYGYYGFRSPHFFIRDPQLIQKIGIKDFDSFTNHADNRAMMSDETISSMLTVLKDEKWKDMRMKLAPVFTEIKISQVFHVISACNREAISYLKETVKSEGTEIDFADFFHQYSNDVIASAAFGLKINSYKDKENEFSNMVKVLLRTRSLCVAVKEFYLTISPQVLKIYRLNRIYIKALAYMRRLISRTIGSNDKITQEGAIGDKKESEFFKIIKALLNKSSTAIKLIVLTIFPQISIIVHLVSFVQTIRKYVKGLFNSKSKQQRQKEQITCYEETDPQDKKNTFLQMGATVLGKITTSIKLLFFTLFPQILWISRLYFLTKKLINYLRGKTVQKEVFDKNKKKKLSQMESAFLKFQRFVVIIKLLILIYFPKISKIVKLNAFNARALNYLKGAARQTIRQRQDEKIIRHDMVHLMLEALKQKENGLEDKSDDENCSTKYTNKCTESEMVAQCILFLFAGLGPMINMLCATMYELMKNQEIQEKLFEEVANINEELNGTEISYDQLNDMKYLDMVISESLRKWPSVPLLDRICSKPYTLTNADGESIAEFMPDDIICFSVYGSHFDDEYFENPFTFDPERFSEQNRSSIKPLTYFPFGLGSRSCIGSKFGLMVGKIMLYHLVLEFKFDSGPRSIPDLFAAKRRVQLKQSEFYWLTVFPRITDKILC